MLTAQSGENALLCRESVSTYVRRRPSGCPQRGVPVQVYEKPPVRLKADPEVLPRIHARNRLQVQLPASDAMLRPKGRNALGLVQGLLQHDTKRPHVSSPVVHMHSQPHPSQCCSQRTQSSCSPLEHGSQVQCPKRVKALSHTSILIFQHFPVAPQVSPQLQTTPVVHVSKESEPWPIKQIQSRT